MLSIASTCTVSQTPRQRTRGTAQNRATLLMNGWLKAGVTYEFQFVVTNPLGQAMDRRECDTSVSNCCVFFDASSKDCPVYRSHFAQHDMKSYSRSLKIDLVLIFAGPRYVWAKSGHVNVLLSRHHWFRKKLEIT